MQDAQVRRMPVNGAYSPQAAKLIDVLKEGKIGDVLTDEALAATCGKDTRPRGKGYAWLQSAIRHCIDRYSVVWSRMKGANAIKCLDASERFGTVEDRRKRIGKTARRAIKIAATVDPAALSEAERPKFNAVCAQMGGMELLSRSDTTKKLEARKIQRDHDMHKLLEAIK